MSAGPSARCPWQRSGGQRNLKSICSSTATMMCGTSGSGQCDRKCGLPRNCPGFQPFKDRLSRSVKVAWWPGHSTGRYGGSTWFSDQFALDLNENCIAQINIDSPGCRWADEYDGVMWMSEVNDFCKKVIHDVTGKKPRGIRPMRAGDYSFNHIGVTSMYMLMSTIPEEIGKEKGFYTVGGCAGNSWAWPRRMTRWKLPTLRSGKDIRVYVASILPNPQRLRLSLRL